VLSQRVKLSRVRTETLDGCGASIERLGLLERSAPSPTLLERLVCGSAAAQVSPTRGKGVGVLSISVRVEMPSANFTSLAISNPFSMWM
jgi:hypothetical protein